jgi:hypothetical protein
MSRNNPPSRAQEAALGAGGLTPDVVLAAKPQEAVRKRPALHLVVHKDAKGWDTIFLEILVLVIAKDDHGVRTKIVDGAAYLAKGFDHALLMLHGPHRFMGVLLLHGLGPVRRLPHLRRNHRTVEDDAHQIGIGLGPGKQWWIVRDADTQNVPHSHDLLSSTDMGLPIRHAQQRYFGERHAVLMGTLLCLLDPLGHLELLEPGVSGTQMHSGTLRLSLDRGESRQVKMGASRIVSGVDSVEGVERLM